MAAARQEGQLDLSIPPGDLWRLALGTFEQILAYVVFVGWIFYALGTASVIVLRRKRPHVARPYRVPGYPVTPLLFILAAIALVMNTIYAQPKVAGIGLVMVFLGAPAYYYWRRTA